MTNEMYEDLLERNKLQISELNTLTEEQDRHIVELEKEIAELEKENAELNKAKEIIKTFLGFTEAFGYSPSMDKFISDTKQFLREVSE